jgi:HAD superfamily hydrolase (TIGR01509 family)
MNPTHLPSTLMTPHWGALFDWDGVIIDSKALHEAAWNQVAREFGYRHGPEDFRRHFGTQNRRAISETLGWTQDDAQIERISERKEVLYRERLQGSGDLLLPGVRAFLELLEQSGIPRVVVSSSPRLNIDRVLEGAALGNSFQGIVAAEDTSRGKPDPQGFITGAQRLHLPKERCVVFEDAPAGIEAGRRGGMRVVALTTTHAAPELAGADVITERLDAPLFELIESWFPRA